MAVYTTIDDPEAYFQTVLYTGNGSNDLSITLPGDTDMQPDLVWIKQRDSRDHFLFDSVRGVTKYIASNTTAAEDTLADGLTDFNSDGFTIDDGVGINENTDAHVAWCWKAGGGAGSANTTGSINTDSTSVNTTSGFSISTYDNDGNAGDTIGHGIGIAPEFVMIKVFSHTGDWIVGSKGMDSSFDNYIKLSTNAAKTNSDNQFNDTAPSSTLVTLGNNSLVNYSTSIGSFEYVCYAWAPIQGFSKFSSFVGNGNADGTFIYTGFRPAMVMLKRTDSTSSWYMQDNKRQTYNVLDTPIYADSSGAESQSGDRLIDILSNGFKLRGSSTAINASGGTYIYMAFAEAPFVNSNGVPCNAR